MTREFLTDLARQPWAHFALVTLIALAVSALMRRIVYATIRRVTRHKPLAKNIFRRASAPMNVLVPVLAILLSFRALPNDAPDWMATIEHGFGIVLIAGISWLLVRCIGALEPAVSRFNPIDTADNLRARRVLTQVRVLSRTAMTVVVILGLAAVLMTFPSVRQFGTSLLASAGVAGLAVGLAAKPVLSNIIAGVQIALTQPIRIDDVVIVEGQWGKVEEITSTYVVICIWDERRMVVPLQYFIEHPFENWTRRNSQILGSVMLWFDYGVPMEPLRAELRRLCEAAPEWDRRVCILQVVETSERAIQLRALVSSVNASLSWDLRCHVREGLIAFVNRRYPGQLPKLRADEARTLDA